MPLPDVSYPYERNDELTESELYCQYVYLPLLYGNNLMDHEDDRKSYSLYAACALLYVPDERVV